MRFIETSIDGGWVLEPEPLNDERGFFARMWSRDAFTEKGLLSDFVQGNDSYSPVKGTLRGLHYQVGAHAEAKLVRCINGRVFDVMVDMRPGSPTRLRWFGLELTSLNRLLLYVPQGCAHGYLSLEDNCEVIYMASSPHFADAERGVRWNDPVININWPMEPRIVSPKDSHWRDVER